MTASIENDNNDNKKHSKQLKTLAGNQSAINYFISISLAFCIIIYFN